MMLAPVPVASVAQPADAGTGRRRRRRRKVLLLVLDGLRPELIDARRMPNLARLAARGVTFTRSRTGFPSETMVGAGELMAGAYPERSGITSNWMAVPGQASEGTELKSLEGIDAMAAAHGGRALASPSLFQALAAAGMTSAFVGKEGPAELAYRSGATWTVSTAGAYESDQARLLGAARGAGPLAQVVASAGAAPDRGEHDDGARSAWLSTVARAVDAALGPDLLAVWLTDPDSTQHGHGLGTKHQAAALRRADAQVGALLLDLERRGVLADTDIVVASDHGFSEHLDGPEPDLAGVLAAAGLRTTHVIGSGNQHLVRFERPPTARDLARARAAIAASPFAQLVETVIDNPRTQRGDTRRNGRLTGRDLRQGSARAADLYVVYRFEDAGDRTRTDRRRRRKHGAHMPAKPGRTKAGHGSLAWTDLNNTLLVAGPSFERASPGAAPLRTPNAAGIFDVAPTILHLLGAAAPKTMQGRVLGEALAEHGVGDGAVDRLRSTRSTAWTNVRLGERLVRTGLVTEHVGDSDYFVELKTIG